MSKSFPEVFKVVQKIENTVQPVRGSGSHSFAMKDVNHEASWLALSNEVQELDAHAPNCTVTECGEFIERRPSSFGSTLHVDVSDERWRLSTLLLITTQSSLRLRKLTSIRLTCSQTEHHHRRRGYFHCLEVLFQPSPTGREASGFHDISFQSFTECDIDTRKELYTNAVFYGGTAMFQRIVERMT